MCKFRELKFWPEAGQEMETCSILGGFCFEEGNCPLQEKPETFMEKKASRLGDLAQEIVQLRKLELGVGWEDAIDEEVRVVKTRIIQLLESM